MKAVNSDQMSLMFEVPDVVLEMPESPEPEAAMALTKFVVPEFDSQSVRGNAAKQELTRLLRDFHYGMGRYEIFRDFCALSALSISNSTDKTQWEEREKEYLQIIGKYEREDVDKFPKMLSCLATTLEFFGPQDILGQVFQLMEINNKDAGQFFTPQGVSGMMGEMMMTPDIGETINDQGYITLQEPAAGGGSTIFGFCKAMAKAGYNYQQYLHVTAIDIDLRCAQMTYVQMSLLGIPGVVYHGNTLTMEMYSAWCTPMHILNGWYRRGCGLLIQPKERVA